MWRGMAQSIPWPSPLASSCAHRLACSPRVRLCAHAIVRLYTLAVARLARTRSNPPLRAALCAECLRGRCHDSIDGSIISVRHLKRQPLRPDQSPEDLQRWKPAPGRATARTFPASFFCNRSNSSIQKWLLQGGMAPKVSSPFLLGLPWVVAHVGSIKSSNARCAGPGRHARELPSC